MTIERNPWAALGALCVGFFMILLDMTIVAVANPAITTHLNADVSKVIWVTSAYLLAYAVPLLVTGRLGDRIGPKNIYLAGLTVFTIASLACGLSGSINTLIAARAVQGLGAALMAPQTMAVITRIFPAAKRGAAMGAWGSVAGVATLVGPILGGVLVDNLGWEWIFYVNVPIGVIAFALAAYYVPALPTTERKFDIPGVVLSGIGMSLLVFGIQEGNNYHWSTWIWSMIGAGVVVLIGFLIYQSRNHDEPLVPLGLFKDRNFALANVAIMALGSAITALMLPGYFFLQAVRGLTPTQSALVFAPMAVMTGILSPVVGKLADKLHPAIMPTAGFAVFALAQAWGATLMTPHSSMAVIMVSAGLMGLASAFIWAPLTATATRNLPPQLAGAGAGVYNTTRQVGAVLGSAAMSALITARLSANGMPSSFSEAGSGGAGHHAMPDPIAFPFSTALREAAYLPVGVLLISVIAAAFFARGNLGRAQQVPADAVAQPEAIAS